MDTEGKMRIRVVIKREMRFFRFSPAADTKDAVIRKKPGMSAVIGGSKGRKQKRKGQKIWKKERKNGRYAAAARRFHALQIICPFLLE